MGSTLRCRPLAFIVVVFGSATFSCADSGGANSAPSSSTNTAGGGSDGATSGTSGAASGAGTAGVDPTGGDPTAGSATGNGATDGDATAGNTGGPSEPPDGDGLFVDVSFGPHPEVATVIEVTWKQDLASDATWIRFSDGEGGSFASPRVEGTVGEHREVLLGLPEEAAVSFELVAEVQGQEIQSRTFTATNGAAPARMPRPTLNHYDETVASDRPWMLVAVSESTGFEGPHWIQIVDRRGRIVWYHKPAGGEDGALVESFFPRTSRDGSHITFDRQKRFEARYELVRTTLDFRYEEVITLTPAIENYDMTHEGSVLFNGDRAVLSERDSSGEVREIWECGFCTAVSNTVNWDPTTDTILQAFPLTNTVVLVDRESGSVLTSFGDHGSWTMDPPAALTFPHWPVMTSSGTILLSTQADGTHQFTEYELDQASQTVHQVWSWQDPPGTGPRGMVVPIPGTTNLLANLGVAGRISEITKTDKQAVWRLEYGDHLLGNSFLLDSLYDLNRGP